MNVQATRIASADDVYSRHDCNSRSFRSTPPEFFDPCAQCQILVCTSWTEVHDAVAAPRLGRASATIAVCVAAAGFQITRVGWCLSVLSMMSVWTAEAFNTALECLTDLASPDLHPLAGKAKDVAAAVVLSTAVRAATIGTVVFVPHMWTMKVSFP